MSAYSSHEQRHENETTAVWSACQRSVWQTVGRTDKVIRPSTMNTMRRTTWRTGGSEWRITSHRDRILNFTTTFHARSGPGTHGGMTASRSGGWILNSAKNVECPRPNIAVITPVSILTPALTLNIVLLTGFTVYRHFQSFNFYFNARFYIIQFIRTLGYISRFRIELLVKTRMNQKDTIWAIHLTFFIDHCK